MMLLKYSNLINYEAHNHHHLTLIFVLLVLQYEVGVELLKHILENFDYLLVRYVFCIAY